MAKTQFTVDSYKRLHTYTSDNVDISASTAVQKRVLFAARDYPAVMHSLRMWVNELFAGNGAGSGKIEIGTQADPDAFAEMTVNVEPADAWYTFTIDDVDIPANTEVLVKHTQEAVNGEGCIVAEIGIASQDA